MAKTGKVRALGRANADFLQPQTCVELLRTERPQAVINAVAFTAVDQAEDEVDTARQINCIAPSVIATTCASLGIPLIHLSTDYVFDGNGNEPRRPEEQILPINSYGQTKVAGEQAIRSAGPIHAIIRTSWVFSETGSNFVKTMLRLSETRDQISVVADQIGGPTSANAIAQCCLEVAEQLVETPEKAGTFHFSGHEDVSWFSFAKEIFRQTGSDIQVHPIPSSEFPTKAKRPLNSRLDCESLRETFGIARPNWRADLSDVLRKLGAVS